MDVHEILRTKALSVGYGKQKIVEDVSFSARPGEIICLIAPNGEGKSTLLKTLLRQLPPLAGAVWVDDLPLTHVKEEEFAKSCAAVLTQRVNPEMMRCEEVIATGRYTYTGRLGILSTHDRRIVEEIIQLVGIESIRQQVFNRFDFKIVEEFHQRSVLIVFFRQSPEKIIAVAGAADEQPFPVFLNDLLRCTRRFAFAVKESFCQNVIQMNHSFPVSNQEHNSAGGFSDTAIRGKHHHLAAVYDFELTAFSQP